MSSTNPSIDDGVIRSADESDVSGNSLIPNRRKQPEIRGREETMLTPSEAWDLVEAFAGSRIPQRSHVDDLVDRIETEYAGEGIVVADKQTGDILVQVESDPELAEELLKLDHDPDQTVIVRCYE